MKTKLFFFLLVTASISSCTTLKSGTAKSKDIVGVGVIHKPVVADLEVNQQKTSKTMKITFSGVTQGAESVIIRELLNENNADLLIEPKFESITKNGKTELTVTGWLAFYKNFRTIEEKDLKLIDINTVYAKENKTTDPILLIKK
jgi:hypothetical protein